MVPKLEENTHPVSADLISQIDTHFQRILERRKIIRCDSVFQRSAALVGKRSSEMPCLRAKKAMGAPFDFVAAIQTAAILKPMKIITHDCGVICPAFRRRSHIVVPVKKANPLAGFIDSRHADQFGAETRHDDAKAVVFVSKNVQMATAPVFFCVRKLHGSLRQCVILSEVQRSATKSKNPVGLPKSTATGSLDFARDDGKADRSWEQAAHLFGLDDALNTDRHRGCSM